MKENEMTNALQTIQVVQGSVVFGAYNELKKQAINLADQIRTVEVSDENVKLSKKLLASVNKRLKELEDERISIKKIMLEPYQEFEEQVKEIVGIVKDADAFVRNQVKELEEQERMEKQLEISALWQLRVKQYSFYDLVPFTDFLKPKYLTKTMPISAVEKEMVQFLEKVQSDMNVLYTLDDQDAHIDAYLQSFDLGQAMMQVKEQKQRQAQIEQARKQSTKKQEVQDVFKFTVFNQKDATLVAMFMDQNNINYEKDVV